MQKKEIKYLYKNEAKRLIVTTNAIAKLGEAINKRSMWNDWNKGAPILFSPPVSMKGNLTRPRLEINIEDKID